MDREGREARLGRPLGQIWLTVNCTKSNNFYVLSIATSLIQEKNQFRLDYWKIHVKPLKKIS